MEAIDSKKRKLIDRIAQDIEQYNQQDQSKKMKITAQFTVTEEGILIDFKECERKCAFEVMKDYSRAQFEVQKKKEMLASQEEAKVQHDKRSQGDEEAKNEDLPN